MNSTKLEKGLEKLALEFGSELSMRIYTEKIIEEIENYSDCFLSKEDIKELIDDAKNCVFRRRTIIGDFLIEYQIKKNSEINKFENLNDYDEEEIHISKLNEPLSELYLEESNNYFEDRDIFPFIFLVLKKNGEKQINILEESCDKKIIKYLENNKIQIKKNETIDEVQKFLKTFIKNPFKNKQKKFCKKNHTDIMEIYEKNDEIPSDKIEIALEIIYSHKDYHEIILDLTKKSLNYLKTTKPKIREKAFNLLKEYKKEYDYLEKELNDFLEKNAVHAKNYKSCEQFLKDLETNFSDDLNKKEKIGDYERRLLFLKIHKEFDTAKIREIARISYELTK
jgi:hypothetical protein